MSVEGLWLQKPAEQVSHTAGQFGDVADNGPHPMVEQALPAAKAPQNRPRAWRKRIVWLALGTGAWLLARLGVRHVFGDGATLLEYVLLLLVLGSVIGLTSRSAS